MDRVSALLTSSIWILFSTGLLQAELGNIIIPDLALKNATLEEAVGAVVQKSVEADPQKQGVNVFIKRGDAEAVKLTLDLKGQSVQSILGMIADLSGLELVPEQGAYVLKSNPVSSSQGLPAQSGIGPPVLKRAKQAADIAGYAERLIIPEIRLVNTPLNQATGVISQIVRMAMSDPGILFSMEVHLGRPYTNQEFAQGGPLINMDLKDQSLAAVLNEFAGQLDLQVRGREGVYSLEP